jgi:NADH-quinone oxidoreductase subunit L
VDIAWLAPVACAAAFFFNVIIARQLGGARHAVAAGASILAIVGAFAVFLFVFTDALAHLGPGAEAHGPVTAAAAAVPPNHLLFDRTPWFRIGQFDFHLTMVVDWLSIMMLGVVGFLASLIQIYAIGYMKGDNRFWWFFSVMSLFCAAMFALVLSYDFLFMYIAWELVGLCSFLLIGFWYHERDNAEAAKKAFITTRVGDVGFFIGLALLFLNTGTFRMDEIFAAIGAGRIDPTIVTIAGILVFMGAVGKSGQFPLHVWLPDAMAGPTPVSALVHSATMVAAGVYLVGRAYPLFIASEITMAVIATIGTITAIFAATIALTQRDIKKVLAYSTVSQLGYMMMALGIGAYTAGLFHLFTHAFFKALLFLGAGSIIHSMEPVLHGTGRSPNDIFWMGGLRKRMPVTFWTFIIAALSLAGIPPLAGFWSKDEILVGALDVGAWLPLTVGILTAFLTAFYMFRAIFLAFFGEERWRLATTGAVPHGPDAASVIHAGAETPAVDDELPHTPIGPDPHGADQHGPQGFHTPHESPWVMALPLIAICVPAIAAGWINIPGVFTPFADAIHFGEAHHAESMNWAMAATGALAGLLGIGLAVVLYLRPVVAPAAISRSMPGAYWTLYNKYYFDEAYQWVVNKMVLGVAGLAATFDRKVINDGLIDAPGHLTVAAGERLRYISTGRVYHYAFGVVIGIVAVGLIMLLLPVLT